jgi:hypothetical protein
MEIPVRVPFAFVYRPGSPASQAVLVGLQALMHAVFVTAPIATGPHERVMAMASMIGAELAALPIEDRGQAEDVIRAVMHGAVRGTQEARFASVAPAGSA